MKKKLTAVALIVCMIAIMLVGASLAYFTDETDVATNTFTAGKVDISLWENEQEVTENFTGLKYDALKPGETVEKAVEVQVAENSLDAYIAARIVVTGADLMDLLGVEDQYVDLTGLVSGGFADEEVAYAGTYDEPLAWENANYVLTQEFDLEKGEYIFTYYVKVAQAAGAKVKLFDELTIPEKWGNEEMAEFDGMSMEITAYAVQADELGETLDSCYKAIKATFTF